MKEESDLPEGQHMTLRDPSVLTTFYIFEFYIAKIYCLPKSFKGQVLPFTYYITKPKSFTLTS